MLANTLNVTLEILVLWDRIMVYLNQILLQHVNVFNLKKRPATLLSSVGWRRDRTSSEEAQSETDCGFPLAMGAPTWAIWAAVSPLAPMKTMARAEETLRGEKNTFRERSSSPNIFNKLMAKMPLASPRRSIGESLYQKHNTEAHQPNAPSRRLVTSTCRWTWSVMGRITAPQRHRV